MNMNAPDLPGIFHPPVNRSMQTLDRAFFRKVVPLAVATVSDLKQISNLRRELDKSGDILKINPIKPLRDDESAPGAKCILLRLGIDAHGRFLASPVGTPLMTARTHDMVTNDSQAGGSEADLYTTV